MNSWRLCSVASVLFALTWTRLAEAYRPFDGTDADVAAPHEIELEIGPVGYHRHGDDQFLVAPAIVFNYGLAPGFEAVLEGRHNWGLTSDLPLSEVEDAAVSLKSMLREGSLQRGQGLSIALETGLLLPASESRFGLHVASVLSMQWPALTVHLNLNNDLLTSWEHGAGATVIVEGPGAWPVRPVAEVLFERVFESPGSGQSFTETVLVGAIAPCSDSFSFDAAFRYGWVEDEQDEDVRLGFTWNFEAF